MTLQWQDELEAKFGLTFDIVDRERVAELRRAHGFAVNPWATGSRFILSHRLMTDETYVAGLRDLLGDFRPRALTGRTPDPRHMRTQRERFCQLAARVQRTAKPPSRRVERLAVAASFHPSLKQRRCHQDISSRV
jgi:hypothetical protein